MIETLVGGAAADVRHAVAFAGHVPISRCDVLLQLDFYLDGFATGKDNGHICYRGV